MSPSSAEQFAVSYYSERLRQASKVVRRLFPKQVSRELDLSKERGSASYYSHNLRVPKSVRGARFSSMITSLLDTGLVPPSLKGLVNFPPIHRMSELRGQFGGSGYGKISFLQEGSAKARVVCTPSAWIQAGFRPLADFLDIGTRILEAQQFGNPSLLGLSCRFDQNSGGYLLSQWLGEGLSMYSFDLSSATDRFPLQLQTSFLDGIGLAEWGKALEELSRGKFEMREYPSPSRNDSRKERAQKASLVKAHLPEFWTYTVGQPMGLCCSMSLFHLTHYFLLQCEASRLNLKEKSFAVLGDDVIIGNKLLAESYRGILNRLGVDIPEGKSFQGKLQSFAGFRGVTTPKGVTVFRPFKFGPDFTFDGRGISVLANLGQRGLRKWTGWWQELAKAFDFTRPYRNPDLSPLVPELDRQIPVASRPGSEWIATVLHAISITSATPDNKLGGLGSMLPSTPEQIRQIAEMFKQNHLSLRQVFNPRETSEATQAYAEPLARSIRRDPLINLLLESGELYGNPVTWFNVDKPDHTNPRTQKDYPQIREISR